MRAKVRNVWPGKHRARFRASGLRADFMHQVFGPRMETLSGIEKENMQRPVPPERVPPSRSAKGTLENMWQHARKKKARVDGANTSGVRRPHPVQEMTAVHIAPNGAMSPKNFRPAANALPWQDIRTYAPCRATQICQAATAQPWRCR